MARDGALRAHDGNPTPSPIHPIHPSSHLPQSHPPIPSLHPPTPTPSTHPNHPHSIYAQPMLAHPTHAHPHPTLSTTPNPHIHSIQTHPLHPCQGHNGKQGKGTLRRPWQKRRGGGIEPLHVSMPRELKSRPSTSPTHPGSLTTTQVARSWAFFGALGAEAGQQPQHSQCRRTPPYQGKMDTLGFEPRAFRMRSGCDTTTPCALYSTASGVSWCLLWPSRVLGACGGGAQLTLPGLAQGWSPPRALHAAPPAAHCGRGWSMGVGTPTEEEHGPPGRWQGGRAQGQHTPFRPHPSL